MRTIKDTIEKFREIANERFFDLHIRGCHIVDIDGKTHDICNKAKEEIKKEIEQFIISEIKEILEGLKEKEKKMTRKELLNENKIPTSQHTHKLSVQIGSNQREQKLREDIEEIVK